MCPFLHCRAKEKEPDEVFQELELLEVSFVTDELRLEELLKTFQGGTTFLLASQTRNTWYQYVRKLFTLNDFISFLQKAVDLAELKFKKAQDCIGNVSQLILLLLQTSTTNQN